MYAASYISLTKRRVETNNCTNNGFGFDQKWGLNHAYISGKNFSISIMGKRQRKVKLLRRGIRRGDPPSLYFLIIVVDSHSRLSQKANFLALSKALTWEQGLNIDADIGIEI